MDGLANWGAFGRFLIFVRISTFIFTTTIFILCLNISFKRKHFYFFPVLIILYICFLLYHFWYPTGQWIVRNVQGNFFYVTRQYDKSVRAYLDIYDYDSVKDKLEKVYNEGREYYFDNRMYRKCINFIDEFNTEYSYLLDQDSNSEYIFNSYKELYDEQKVKAKDNKKKKKQELFDLITEMKDRYKYNPEILSIENGFNFNDDFNKYESFEYINDKAVVAFGKIGYSSAGLLYNKTDQGWRLLYKEDNKIYLISSGVILSRYMNEYQVETLDYKETDMYKFLNEYLYNEMFDENEKKAILPIDDDENISLLSESIISKMIIDGKGRHLNSLISRVPIRSGLVNMKNVGAYQHIWIKSDIKNYLAKYVVESSNDEPNIYEKDATDNSINVLPVICVDLNIISEYGKEERIKQEEIKKMEEAAKKEMEIKKAELSNSFNKAFTAKIEAMKTISEYGDDATIDDFDSILIGNSKTYTGNDMPITWILLEKTDDRALLLSKYSLYPISYDELVDYEPEKNRKFNYKDFEDSHYDMNFFNEDELKLILDTEIIISKNDLYNKNNDLSKINRKTFLLGIDDIKKYFSDINGNILQSKLKTYCDKLSENEGNEIGWWLKDIGELWWTAAYIDGNGNLNERGYALNRKLGFRRAMWVKYK